jgi:hypothetical protein
MLAKKKKKKTKTLRFQNEDTKENTIHAQGGSCGGLQGEFQRSIHNLHFTRSPTMVITMGVTSMATFEMEVIELDFKYERRQAMRRF